MNFRISLLLTISLFVSLVGGVPAAAQTALSQFLNTPQLKHASTSLLIKDLNSGKTLHAHDAQRALTPASVQKLITTATALEVLGADYRYTTTVAIDANNPSRILIIGSGDPTIGSSAFDDNPNLFFAECVAALKKALPTNKKYSLYVVDNLFGYMGVSAEWTWEDLGNYYAAGAYGISVFDNTYKLIFNTTKRNACPEIVGMEPHITGLTFQNYLTLNSTGRDNGYIYGAPFSYQRSIRGNIPAGRTAFALKGDIPDPGLMLGQTLANQLQQAGFDIESVETAREDYLSLLCKTDKTPPYRPGKMLYEHRSRPLKEIAQEINVDSNNHFTEHLIRTLGRLQNNDIYSDPLEEGINCVRNFWKSKGLDTRSLTMNDGCGLAPQNAVSAQFLIDLLTYMHKSGNADTFLNTLPRAGVNGTLRSFMANTTYRGKIAAKSGSIGGVLCYAGYLTEGTTTRAFVVMINKFDGTHAEARRAIETLLSRVL